MRSVGLWLLLAVLVILLLGLLFGGWRKGTKLNVPNPMPTGSRSVALLTAPCHVMDARTVMVL